MMDDQSEAVAFLSRGESYGRPDETPRRTDTHSAMVFVIGDRAYKIKRAVKFSFLDYSTLDARVRFCRAELDLNRRTAPALYRQVGRLTRARDGWLEWNGRGALVEPVLEMARFDEDALFDRLAADGRLTPVLMVKLADIIAAFHAAAETAAPRFGGKDGIAAVIADDSANLLGGCPPLDRAVVEDLRERRERALARQGALLDRRRREGKVRRCHGDLHLRNICLFGGEPTLFDCIEFSDDIACIDTLFDFAFVLMDLEHRQLRQLGNLLFNRYCDRRDETAALGALPLLLSARAGIRAKAAVAALKLQPNAAAEAQSYLALATALLDPAAPPRLIAVGGLSGSGKSTIAAGLAGDFAPAPGARHIRSDVVRKTLMQVAPETPLPPSAYTLEVSARVYAAARDQAAAALAGGYSVILDATFIDPRERETTAAVAAEAGAAFTGLWLTAPDHVLLDRVASRRGDSSDADRAVLEQQLKAELGAIAWTKVEVASDAGSALAAARRALALA